MCQVQLLPYADNLETIDILVSLLMFINDHQTLYKIYCWKVFFSWYIAPKIGKTEDLEYMISSFASILRKLRNACRLDSRRDLICKTTTHINSSILCTRENLGNENLRFASQWNCFCFYLSTDHVCSPYQKLIIGVNEVISKLLPNARLLAFHIHFVTCCGQYICRYIPA